MDFEVKNYYLSISSYEGGSIKLRDYLRFDKPWCTRILEEIVRYEVMKRGGGHTVIFHFRGGYSISIALSEMRVPRLLHKRMKLVYERMDIPIGLYFYTGNITKEEWNFCLERILDERRKR